MQDFNLLRKHCENESRIFFSVVDEFLLHYAARRDKLDQEFENRISRFNATVEKVPSNLYGLMQTQYIGHRIFKKGGLINKYLDHAAIKDLGTEKQNYLKQLAGDPWRFSFAEVVGNPAPDFFEMKDAFTGEIYLLYSPSVTQISAVDSVMLWFNLIGFNGSCWQSFGPVVSFKCFSPDDIFFYASELNPKIESDEELSEDIEENPIRYMMLVAGSNYPLLQSRGHEMIQVYGEGHSADLDVQKLKKKFKVEYVQSIFRISHPLWSEHPHFAEAYYAEESGMVTLTALTDLGYQEFSTLLIKQDIIVPPDPDIRIHLPILTLLEDLYRKRPELNPHARLFQPPKSPGSEKMISKLNHFMELALPIINADQEPDVDALARKAGVDPDTARDLLKTAMDKIRGMRNQR